MPKFELNTQKWINVGALFLLLMVTWGITFNSSGMYTAPVQATLGVERSEILMTYTYRGVAMVLGTILTGILLKKFKVLTIMRAGGLLLFISYYLMSKITSLPQYFIVSSIHVLATTMSGFIPVSIVIRDWFGKKSATALGLAFMGSGFGGMLFNILGGKLISSKDWRFAATVISFIIITCVILSIFILVKEPPAGYVPEGEEVSNTDGTAKVSGIMLADAMKKPSFWLLAISLFILSISINSIINNVSPALVDLGYTIEYASTITGIAMVGMALGKAITGFSIDKFGVKFTSVLGTIFLALGYAGLLFGNTLLGIGIIVFSFTLGTPMGSLAVPAFASINYGLKDYASIQSFFQTSFSIGSIFGPIMMSMLYGRFGNYNSSWIVIIALTLLSAAIMFLLLPSLKKSKELH